MEATLAPRVAAWLCQIGMAVILIQTLYFKFTYAPETQVIFAHLGGRPAATLAGLAELACAVLLLLPRGAVWGALLALGVMGGAIASHLFVIGIEVVDPATGRGDGGLLFGLALTVTVLALIVLFLRRSALGSVLRVRSEGQTPRPDPVGRATAGRCRASSSGFAACSGASRGSGPLRPRLR